MASQPNTQPATPVTATVPTIGSLALLASGMCQSPKAIACNTRPRPGPNALAASGTLTVVVNTHPVFGSATVANGSLVLSGAAGVANGNFYLLGSTNLLTPLANWTRLLTNQFDPNGNFDVTNPLPPNTPSEFYRLQVP